VDRNHSNPHHELRVAIFLSQPKECRHFRPAMPIQAIRQERKPSWHAATPFDHFLAAGTISSMKQIEPRFPLNL